MRMQDAVDLGWPFRRRGMIQWMFEADGRMRMTRVDRHSRDLIGAASEPVDITPSDLRADDWEVLVWRSFDGTPCGVYDSTEAIVAARR